MTRLVPRAAAVAALLALASAPSLAQHGEHQQHGQHGPGGCPMMGGAQRYDTATVETVAGTVARVNLVGRDSARGVHVLLEVAKQRTLTVHLGPKSFLDAQSFAVAAGDRLEVTGSRVTIGDAPALLAARVRKGATRLTLRDAQGAPAWATGGMHGGHGGMHAMPGTQGAPNGHGACGGACPCCQGGHGAKADSSAAGAAQSGACKMHGGMHGGMHGAMHGAPQGTPAGTP